MQISSGVRCITSNMIDSTIGSDCQGVLVIKGPVGLIQTSHARADAKRNENSRIQMIPQKQSNHRC